MPDTKPNGSFISLPIYPSLCFILIIIPLYGQGNVSAQEIAGWVECAYINEAGIEIRAKLDSGADNSSLNVRELYEYKRNGSTFVRFTIRNHHGQQGNVMAEVIRTARIKRHTSGPDHRQVVLLDVCLEKTCKKVEVNLADRSNYTYQLLLGRSFLKDDFLIDPSKKFILTPHCK